MKNKQLLEAIQSVIIQSPQEINEALEASAHKALATKAANASKDASGLTAAERISKDVIPERVTIPLNRTATPDTRVISHLKSHGYSLAGDYTTGLASHESSPNRKIKIGKLLSLTNAPTHIKTAFEKDPARQGIKADSTSIVISRNPKDVAAMSTHQNWQSCQTLGGVADKDGKPNRQEPGLFKELVPGIVGSGAHIAYLVHDPKDVDKHYKPIARTTLNVFNGSNGHKILRPSEVYGDEWEGFHKTVKDWSEKNFPMKDPIYIRHHGAYQEGQQSFNNFAPEHDEYWKKHHNTESRLTHPNPEVLSHNIDELLRNNTTYLTGEILKNPNVAKKDADRVADLVSNINEIGAERFKANMIGSMRHPEHIQKFIDRDKSQNGIISEAISKNNHSTPEQLHHVLDKHGASPNGHGGTMQTVYQSTNIIRNVGMHSNADDSHFNKILNLEELNSQNEKTKISGAIEHQSAMEGIAKNYKSEDIGKKLLTLNNITRSPFIVNDVSMKHPHLLNYVDDTLLNDSYKRTPSNKNLENEALKRGTPELLRTVANHTSDKNLLNAMVNHADPQIAGNAQFNLKMKEMYGN